MSGRSEIFAAIEKERDRQEAKWSGAHSWGEGSCAAPLHPGVKVAVLVEEVGEVARAVLEHDDVNLRIELIQVAAVAVAMLEGLT